MVDDKPWLTIIGIGEDGPAGLSAASRAALAGADLVAGAPRHLALLGETTAETLAWPAPFSDGIARLLAHRGRRVVMLASGDPFWFGAGPVVTRTLSPDEWTAHPAPSTFALAAARLGWPLETTTCLGLHAAPLTRLRPYLAPAQRLLILLRNGEVVAEITDYLRKADFGASRLTIMEALGGSRQRIRTLRAADAVPVDVAHPVAIAVEVAGDGAVLPLASGRPDDWFAHDGQITKRPVRALTLSALAPRPGELLWDIGTGSGAIAIEWLLAHPSTAAIGIEADAIRAGRARTNAAALGVDRLRIIHGRAPDALAGLPDPQVVFIGGGLSDTLLGHLWGRLAPGTRLVANAVTLESEALLAQHHATHGGTLLRLDLCDVTSIGRRRGWRASYPIVQWSVTR